MKRIISLTLALLMLAALLLTAVSCEFGMESKNGYTQLRDHIISVSDEKRLQLDGYTIVKAEVNEDGAYEVFATVGALKSGSADSASAVGMRVTLKMNGSVEKAILYCDIIRVTEEGEKVTGSATAEVLLTHYTGNDPVEFITMKGISIAEERSHREFATTLLNSILLSLDLYMTATLDMNVRDLGFIALSDKYMAEVESAEVEEDLGGAFSPARLKKSGLMLLQGMGMVFLVLIILWIVLLIFKAVFYKDPNKKAPKADKPASAPAEPAPKAAAPVVAAPAPAASDDQLIAVITAAVAAAIDSDPALSSQFASGFRVVSFKKTDKSRNR